MKVHLKQFLKFPISHISIIVTHSQLFNYQTNDSLTAIQIKILYFDIVNSFWQLGNITSQQYYTFIINFAGLFGYSQIMTVEYLTIENLCFSKRVNKITRHLIYDSPAPNFHIENEKQTW